MLFRSNAHTNRLRRLMSQPLSGVLAALAIICLVSSLLSNAFLDAYNLDGIAYRRVYPCRSKHSFAYSLTEFFNIIT